MDTPATKILSDDLIAELCEAAKFGLQRTRDPEVMKKTRQEMIELREAIFRRNGLLDIGVPAIRELRDGADA
jgi:hypothetical protein